MSSYLRRLQRKAARKRADNETGEQPTRIHSRFYEVLHPTRGWKRISNARVTAQQWMGALLDHVLPERTRKAPVQWRKPMPPQPSTITRQQRRHAARGKRSA